MPTISVTLDRDKTIRLRYSKVPPPPPLETRCDIWVMDLAPGQIANVGIILEALIAGTWHLVGGKIVDVTVYDPDGNWYTGSGYPTLPDNWSWGEVYIDRPGVWTFKVSFPGDGEYGPSELTREYTA